jgi:diguanylate cyclase (GGDEF)-like protein
MWSFRNRLLFLLIGLVALAETVTLFTALASTSTTERQRANDQLVDGAQIAQLQLEFRERQLANSVAVLTTDYGLRDAVASGDAPTVISALENHAERVGATLALVLDLDGRVIARSGGDAVDDPELARAIGSAFADDMGRAHFVTTSGGVYQMFLSPILAPDEIARVAMGVAVDAAFAQELRQLVNVEVAFIGNGIAGRSVITTTVPALRVEELAEQASSRDLPGVVAVGGEDYLTTVTHLSNVGPQVDLALLKPMRVVLEPFHVLARNLALIIGLTLAAAVVVGIYLGRSAARPVQRLAAGAARIASGDYSQQVEGSGGRELAHLAQAFNSMQQGIADRETQLRHVARHDVATGLPNRLHMEEWLTERLRELPADLQLGVAVVAITNLPEISANLGFDITDHLTRHVARSIGGGHDAQGIVARMDTARFVVARRGVDADSMRALLDQALHRTQLPLETAGIKLQAAVVMGAALAPADGTNANELLRCAEAAIQTAISRNQPCAFFEHASDELQRRHLKLGADLPQALESGQLYLKFQPKVRMSDRRTVGVEALVRWRHPEFAEVSPAEFIPIAERTGTSGLVTRWVLRGALSQLSDWQQIGVHIGMSVNLSVADVLNPDLLQYILGSLRDARLTPGALTLEITEGVLLEEPEAARRNIEMLRLAGVRFSIDDFGTGYSSLSQLRVIAADELKIDQSFVRGLGSGPEHVAVIRAIVELGHGLGLKTVAEGVETEEQWRPLAELGCDQVQGYLTGAPQVARDLTAMLSAEAAMLDVEPSRTVSLRVLELRSRD